MRRFSCSLYLLAVACSSEPASQPPTAQPTLGAGPRLLAAATASESALLFDVPGASTPVAQFGGRRHGFAMSVFDATHDQLVVADPTGVRFYARTSSGLAAPVRRIDAKLERTWLVAVEPTRNLLVVVDEFPSLTTANEFVERIQTWALDAPTTAETLRMATFVLPGSNGSGLGPRFLSPYAVAGFAHDELLVASPQTRALLAYPLTAAGELSPTRTATPTGTSSVSAPICYDAVHDELWVGAGPTSLEVFPRVVTGEVTPSRRIDAGLAMRGCAVDASHNDVLLVGDGGLYVLPRTATGTTLFTRTLAIAAVDKPALPLLDPAHDELWITGARALAFPRTASGDATALRRLTDGAPSRPRGVAFDAERGDVWVMNENDLLEVYELGRPTSAPTRTILGPSTGLATPEGIAFRAKTREVYVSNHAARTITVYAAEGSGDAAPRRTMRGTPSGSSSFWGLALDESHGELFVADSAAVHVFPIDASGDVPAIRSIEIAKLRFPRELALDLDHDELWVQGVTDAGFAVGAIPRASVGTVELLRAIAGNKTKLGPVSGLAYDPVRGVIAASHGLGVVLFPRDASDDVSPLFTRDLGETGGLTFLP